MALKKLKNRLLLVQIQTNMNPFKYLFKDVRKLREILLNNYPKMKNWFPKKTFDLDPIWKERPLILWHENKANTAGFFIAANLDTPTTVMKGSATPERILTRLKQAKKSNYPYTHVGFSVYVDSYSLFIECAEAVKIFDENIITIAGNVGALFKETTKYVDYVCIGDGIRFMRELLGENTHKPYQFNLSPTKLHVDAFKLRVRLNIVQLVTKLGCPMNCDFCITKKMFKNFIPAFATPQQVHKSLVEFRNKINKQFIILMCEPTAVVHHNWWYELFDLFKNEPLDYPIFLSTTYSSLRDLDFDRINRSSLRFEMVFMGVESFYRKYSKNQGYKDMKKLIKKLENYGIGTYASYIIGFDHHNHKNVWEEIYRLADLNAANYVILNLKPLPLTPLWEKLKKDNRLLNLPNDFYYIDYFQAFKHPHFKPGFEDMLPLFYNIYEYLEKEIGNQFLNLITIYDNISKKSDYVNKTIKMLKFVSGNLFSSWKQRFNPSKEQNNNYLSKLGSNSLSYRTLDDLFKDF